jgi:hypothetical protein
MNIEGLEKRVSIRGRVTYWKDGVILYRHCSKCGEIKEISNFRVINKAKRTYRPECKRCERERQKEYYKNNPDKAKEYRKEYYKNNSDKLNEICKRWRENNTDKVREGKRKYYENNSDKIKEYSKRYFEENKEYCHKLEKKLREKRKQNNLQKITNVVEQINPTFEQLNLPIYGYIYKFENIKTGHVYIGETINPLKERYKSNVIQGWIKERLKYDNQKFKDELIEEDIKVTETLDVAFCQYHLDKLEAYYINKYDSYNNGYNNREGNYNTTDGLKEFNEILAEHNLKFVDGKLIQIKNTHQDR